VFILLFWVGLVGFTAMTLLGFVHFGGHKGATGGRHAPAHHHGAGAKAGHHGKIATGDATSNPFLSFWSNVSPLDIFSLALGAGAAGILLHNALKSTELDLAAIATAILFTFAIVRPLMNAIAHFASRPSEGLEGMVAKTAVAVTKFDGQGRGLVRVTLDGQNVQVLAHLEAEEIERGTLVAKGDAVTIIEVDKKKNTCLVTRELSA